MTRYAFVFAAVLWGFLRPAIAQQYDLVIRNGHIVDGTGSPWYSADLAIKDGRIVRIGKIDSASAAKSIDAHGLTVAPGFIDMLGQSEVSMLVDPHVPSKIFQGITTEITGEGNSIAPVNDRMLAEDRAGFEHYHLTPDWRTLADYFKRLEAQGMGINLATYVGATSVRRMVIGNDDRAPTAEELARMQGLVLEAMHQGAMGVSTALQYSPAPYAKTEELVALASTAASVGGIYATHMRSEGDGIFAALDETFRIAREAQIPVEIWHLKARGSRTGARCRRSWAVSRRRGPRGWMFPQTRMRIRRGRIRSRRSFRPGRTMAATRRWWRGSRTRRSGRGSATRWSTTRTGTTSGWRSRGPRG